jgi:hypothetical protein
VDGFASGRKTIIMYNDGSRDVRTGGTLTWRNNNPGNLRPGSISSSHGSIGQAHGFSVFPDAGTGGNAQVALLYTKTYQEKTVNQTIAAYAPSTENNTPAYQQFVQNAVGVSGNTQLNTLSATQMGTLATTIRQYEGSKAGSVTHDYAENKQGEK